MSKVVFADSTNMSTLTEKVDNENEPFMALGPFYDYVYREKARIPTCVKTVFNAMTKGIE